MANRGWLALRLSIVLALLLRSSLAGAYAISIVGTPETYGRNLSVSTSGSRLSLNDYFNQYDQSRWEIASVHEDAMGGIEVDYNFPEYGTWDSYGARARVEFQILADPGDLTPRPIEVDIWGSGMYQQSILGACCWSEPPRVEFYGQDGPFIHFDSSSNGALSTSQVLWSNTSYYLTYDNSQYVEGSPLDSYFPTYFASRALYESFVASRGGTAGIVYSSAWGFMNYNLAVRAASVPEPGTFGLFGGVLVGVFLARRRPAIRST